MVCAAKANFKSKGNTRRGVVKERGMSKELFIVSVLCAINFRTKRVSTVVVGALALDHRIFLINTE